MNATETAVHSQRKPQTAGAVLSSHEKDVLQSATARILPSEEGPGAAEARVTDYILNALEDPRLHGFLPLLRRGLEFLDYLAQESLTSDFAKCSSEDQDRILHQAQIFPNNDSRRFFDTLVELTLEGFLCDPSRGGNANQVGWLHIEYQLQQPPECG